jgi:magnesium transporter
MIRYYSKNKEGEMDKIPKFTTGCWVNVVDPSSEELDFLSKEFNLDRGNLVDGLDIYENPRFESEEKIVYLYLTIPTKKISHQHISSFLIIYSSELLITLSKFSIELLENIFSSKKKISSFSSSGNLLNLLFSIPKLFEKSVLEIMKDTRINKAGLEWLKNEDIAKLINDEDKLNQYISSFGVTIQIYDRIMRSKLIKFAKKDGEIIEDLIIDLNEVVNLGKQTLKTVSNMRVYYSTKLSNDLNKAVTLLTIFTIFLAIPTLISSIYGMNIRLPFQESENILWGLGFSIFALWGVMYLVIKHYKLI